MQVTSVGRTAVQPAVVGAVAQVARFGSTAVQPEAVGVVVQADNVGNTAVHPGAVGVVMQVARFGNTAVQPGAVGVVVQADNVGSTAVQPGAVGVVVQVASEGNTTVQPSVVGADVQTAMLGSTELHPVNAAFAIQSTNIGRLRFGNLVTMPVIVPFSIMLLPARRATALFVAEITLPLIVRLSVVTPAPLAPASSHIWLRADTPPLPPLPPMVSGLLATMVIFPPVVFDGLPFDIHPAVVKAPVLWILISPDVPLLVADKELT